jgi:hypothetical protein
MKRITLLFSAILLISCSKETLQQKLTVTASPANGGSISPASNSFEKGSQVNLIATPAGEYTFKQWQGGVSGTNNPTMLTMDTDKDVTGVFEKRQYPLTLTIEGNGTVKEEIIAVASQAQYPSGTSVKLSAKAGAGAIFSEWKGDLASKDSILTTTITKPLALTASFVTKPTKFVSKSPTYISPNSTVGQLKNNIYFPGNYLTNDSLKIKYGLNFWSDYAYFDPAKCYGDFDGDGKLDLFFFQIKSNTALWASENGRYVYVNDALNKNPKITYYPATTSWMPNFEVNDFNGDGKLDILQFTWNSHQLSDGKTKSNSIPLKIIYFNSTGIEVKDIGIPIDVHDASSGDVDNDNDIDILAWDYVINTGPILYKNDGSGNFTTTSQNETFKGLSEIRVPNHSYQMTAIEFIDLNGDKYLDIVRGNLFNFEQTDLSIYWGNSKGTYDLINNTTALKNEIILTDRNTVLGFNFLDYDKDGDLDLFCVSTLNYNGFDINVFENKGNNTFKEATKQIIDDYSDKTGFTNFYNLRFYDVDSDGDYDMIPDQLANWGQIKYSNKMYWENTNGKFIRKNK